MHILLKDIVTFTYENGHIITILQPK